MNSRSLKLVRVPIGLIRMLGLCTLAGVLLAGILAPVAIGSGVLSNQISDSVDNISANIANSEIPLVTTVTDRNNTPIAQLFSQYRLPVSYNQISPNMTAALIDIEDHRFYSESGIDPKGLLRAAMNNSEGGNTQGASTITQQFVRNYLINVVDRSNKAAQASDQAPTLARKLREAKMALQVEQTMSKNNILTGYLNVVDFGPGATGPYGIRAAAKSYFNTTPDQLSVAQSALLAGMVNNPISLDPYKHPDAARKRRDLVIDRMVQYGSLPASDGAVAKSQPLGVVPGDGPAIPQSSCLSAAQDAGFFCDYAVSYLEQAGFTEDQIFNGGYTIKTTMDSTIAQDAQNAADARVPPTQDGVANTFVIIQPGQTSHNVVAMVSNRALGYDANQGQVGYDQPAEVSDQFGGGSTFKLFTTAAAMEQGKAGLNTKLPNPQSACFPLPIRNRYTPCYPLSNDNKTNTDPIPLHEALAISPNTAFVGLELQDGMSSVLDMAYRLGMRNSMESNEHGSAPITDPKNPLSKDPAYDQPQLQAFLNTPAFTLGFSPLSTLEHANVGATLASGGVWCTPNPILSVTDRYGNAVPVRQQPCEQVLNPAAANTMLSGMSQDTISGTSAFTARAANWTRPTAGKTGTTQQNESVGFLGIVDGYAASSLIFADGSQPAKICATVPPRLVTQGDCAGGFGGTIAAPTFFDAFNQILAGQPDQPLPDPDPGFMDVGDHGPLVPFVFGDQESTATSTLQQAGYQVDAKEFDSALPKGTVIGETPQSDQPTGSTITIYVSTGVVPAPPATQQSMATAPGATTGG